MSILRLKPCPFCGSSVRMEIGRYGYDNGIHCRCGISIESDDADKLAAVWNTRTALLDEDTEIERVQEAMKLMDGCVRNYVSADLDWAIDEAVDALQEKYERMKGDNDGE